MTQQIEQIFDEISPIQQKLVEFLAHDGPQPRSELVKKIGAPRTTIYDNLHRLQLKGLIRKFTKPRNTRGRPIVFFALANMRNSNNSSYKKIENRYEYIWRESNATNG